MLRAARPEPLVLHPDLAQPHPRVSNRPNNLDTSGCNLQQRIKMKRDASAPSAGTRLQTPHLPAPQRRRLAYQSLERPGECRF